MSSPSTIESPQVQRMAHVLRRGIQKGQWPVGSSLPTTRQLAREYGVGLATVQSVLEQLEQQGLIERRPRKAVTVKARTPQMRHAQRGLGQLAIVGRNVMTVPDESQSGGWGGRVMQALQSAALADQLHPLPMPFDLAADDVAQSVLDRIEAAGPGVIGTVIFNTSSLRPLPAMLDQIGMPWITINRMTPDQPHNYVAADNLAGCRLVGECLARMGRLHVLVLMVTGVQHSETESEKITGLLQGFLHADAPLTGIHYVKCHEVYVNPYRLTRQHIDHYGPPQAIFVLSDHMASGAIEACIDAGLHVPGDVQMVGGAGLELACHTRPPLAVITQPMEAIGQQACQMIQDMIRRNSRRIEPRRICGQFIVRGSLPVPEPLLSRLEQRYPEMIVREIGRLPTRDNSFPFMH